VRKMRKICKAFLWKSAKRYQKSYCQITNSPCSPLLHMGTYAACAAPPHRRDRAGGWKGSWMGSSKGSPPPPRQLQRPPQPQPATAATAPAPPPPHAAGGAASSQAGYCRIDPFVSKLFHGRGLCVSCVAYRS
jgi:hypothetical protein